MSNPQIFRAGWHDYRSRCIYMVTFNKRKGIPGFSTLDGNWQLTAGTPGSTKTVLSSVGTVIRDWIRRLPLFDPAIKVLQYVVMPDHVHILLFVQRPTTIHIGNTIARLKATINQYCGIGEIFENGYNDQILKSTRLLDTLYRYIQDNPRRLAVRQANREFFRKVTGLSLCGWNFRAYGNLHLIDCPFKEQVVVHRADTEEKRRSCRDLWLYTAANRGVLVSPFISPAEKAIRDEAEAVGGRFIMIVKEPMDDRFKPVGREFELCSEGRLLLLAPWPENGEKKVISRGEALEMNRMAERICALPSISRMDMVRG